MAEPGAAGTGFDDAGVRRLAHDLRASLSGIQGYVRLLLAERVGTVPEAQRECLQDVLACAREVEALAAHLSEYAVGLAQDAAAPEGSARDVLRDAVAAAGAAGGRGLSFEAEVPEALEARRPGPLALARLRRVADLLLATAARFTPDGGRVRLRAVPLDEGAVRLEVEDQGRPLTGEEAVNLFRPLGRRIPLHQRGDPGSGMEMAIAARHAQRCGGHAEAVPLASGNLVRVTLPLA